MMALFMNIFRKNRFLKNIRYTIYFFVKCDIKRNITCFFTFVLIQQEQKKQHNRNVKPRGSE